jgi:LmbE family N-acetylglucosaminyl deacetylase
MTPALDILALAAHRDDVEQTCGGTLLKMAQRGYRTGILDLTQGEMGTRGSAEDRAREAAEAAKYCALRGGRDSTFPMGGSRTHGRTG